MLTLLATGCDYTPKSPFAPNQRPVVELTSAPVDTSAVAHYVVTLLWSAYDPDGTISHFLYAIDPPSAAGSDTTWIKTEEYEKQLLFPASSQDPNDPNTRFRDFHVFAIKAVDNTGNESEIDSRAFFAYTVAPSVSIVSPAPSALISKRVPPSLKITWVGRDDDAVFTDRPVQYKYLLLGPSSEITPDDAVRDPDAVRDRYAPSFVGWDSTGADQTTAVIKGLTPGTDYLFVIIAIDEAGAYSPVFTLTNNMLRIQATFAGANGPKLTLWNETFSFTYTSGRYSTDERLEIALDVPAGQPIDFHWVAEPQEGTSVRFYRWTLDIQSVFDNTPRNDELNDTHFWSFPRLNLNMATVGPFNGGEVHRFYVDVEDDVGFKSLAIVRFNVVQATFEKELLIVDDTRYLLDSYNTLTRCISQPTGRWPTAAELDTFFYARGGVPWQCYPFDSGQPTPPSLPGLFAGYDFDTLGTRGRSSNLTIPLSTIGQYRRVIWMNDQSSASSPPSLRFPIPAMRFMSRPNTTNWLSVFVQQGGEVWGFGGGFATAAFIEFSQQRRGTFMFEHARWLSDAQTYWARVAATRFTGRFGDSAAITRSAKYANLPPKLEAKTPPTDPLEIEAPSRRFSDFYQSRLNYELMQFPNHIVEDVDPGPAEDLQSTLDTLYLVRGSGVPQPTINPHNVAMTYYHGPGQGAVIFSGFDVWRLKREHGQALVDFVLQEIWGIPKNPVRVPARRRP